MFAGVRYRTALCEPIEETSNGLRDNKKPGDVNK